LFPRVHRVFTHLKTWLSGIHRGVSRKHLPYYLNEFVFRFNRHRTPMAAFRLRHRLALRHVHRLAGARVLSLNSLAAEENEMILWNNLEGFLKIQMGRPPSETRPVG
jgi:hypothetical protein